MATQAGRTWRARAPCVTSVPAGSPFAPASPPRMPPGEVQTLLQCSPPLPPLAPHAVGQRARTPAARPYPEGKRSGRRSAGRVAAPSSDASAAAAALPSASAAAAAAPRRAVPTAAARVAGAPLLAPGGAVARGPCAGAPRLCCSPPREARRGLPAMPGQPLRALPLPALPLPPSLSLPVSGSQDLTLRRVEHRGAAAAPGLHGRRTRPPAARSPAGAARGPEQNPGWPQGLSHSALRAHWPPAPTA